ncbi:MULTISPECIES: hypothetical protein [unclassified Herbaspirillum]|uniref:hypothetical protein n=1 Tax=unclassified Herbaspirillum TaxID=2624150 RepID=UPI00114E9558|nr:MULTISPECIES: hypothetical protein [unclassified Herbaspirillum]MBB5391067.1 fructose-1,6-bisphosphatase [Herbaspirillum sp. SJZ102]
MRFHAQVHDENNKAVFECHVIADNSGLAREKIKKYLREHNREQEAKMLISLVEYREDIETKLLVIE